MFGGRALPGRDGGKDEKRRGSTNRPIKTLDFLAVSLYNDFINGVIAQLVARLNGIQKVRGSNPLSSTIVGLCALFFEHGRVVGIMKKHRL